MKMKKKTKNNAVKQCIKFKTYSKPM